MKIDDFLLNAEQICRERGARLTLLRKRVLELVALAGKPIGAYALLDLLKQEDNESRKAAPPTIYRALDFLLQHGLVHRIASHNTYIVCDHPGHRHAGLFFVCSSCGSVTETNSHKISHVISDIADEQGFKMLDENLEVTGLCSSCKQQD